MLESRHAGGLPGDEISPPAFWSRSNSKHAGFRGTKLLGKRSERRVRRDQLQGLDMGITIIVLAVSSPNGKVTV